MVVVRMDKIIPCRYHSMTAKPSLYNSSNTGYDTVMNISKTLYDDFKKDWHNGKYAGLRLGQAFYNHFDLHKHNATSTSLDILYNADNITAEKMISKLIDWNN